MTIHVFKSTDTGAPTLSGTAGDFVNLLDKLLVDGYNSQTVTITQAGGVATASCTSHGFNAMQTVVLSGANESEYNITVRVATVPDANTFTFPVDAGAASPATGTITCKVAPLGWTTAFTASNKRAYRQKAGTNQFYLRVTDDGTGSAAYARVVGYESMSDIDTGTGAFPTAVQLSGGAYCHKSSTANSTTRVWRAWSNGDFIHLNVKIDGTWWERLLKFGDFQRLLPTDLYNTLLDASNSSTHSTSPAGLESPSQAIYSTSASNTCWAPRSYTGSGTAVVITSICPATAASSLSSSAGIAYPSPVFSGILMMPVYVSESGAGLRGVLPGIWGTPHNFHSAGPSDLDTFSGSLGSDLEGRTFEVQKRGWVSQVPVFETSDTWGV